MDKLENKKLQDSDVEKVYGGTLKEYEQIFATLRKYNRIKEDAGTEDVKRVLWNNYFIKATIYTDDKRKNIYTDTHSSMTTEDVIYTINFFET